MSEGQIITYRVSHLEHCDGKWEQTCTFKQAPRIYTDRGVAKHMAQTASAEYPSATYAVFAVYPDGYFASTTIYTLLKQPLFVCVHGLVFDNSVLLNALAMAAAMKNGVEAHA